MNKLKHIASNVTSARGPAGVSAAFGLSPFGFSRVLGALGVFHLRRASLQRRVFLLAIWVFGSLGISASAAPSFDEQRAVIARSVATQPEAVMLSFLKAGLAAGKPTQAIAETRKWLRQNLPKNPLFLYSAGRAAELSGDWQGAVALYQQYLEKADLKSATADEAVYAVYTLLIDRLKDTVGAYAFSKNKGDRLLVCPRARQFDTWFLNQAASRQRQDVTAVANRLRACIQAGLPKELLITRYSIYFRWLIDKLDNGSGFRHDLQLTPEIYDACKKLTAAMTLLEEVKRQLDWYVSVRFYVQQRLAEKDARPPLAEAKALLDTYPRYALAVQTGWIGGTRDNHPNNVGDYKYYWDQELDAKMAPIVEAAAKLSPLERLQLMATWKPGYYNRQRDTQGGLYGIKPIRDYLQANPNLTNSRTGVLILDKPWAKLSPEEALNLAPELADSPEPEASLIRAIAAGIGKKEVKNGDKTETVYKRDLDRMLAALRGPEAWRLNHTWLNGQSTDKLWHYCGRPGDSKKRNAEIAKSKDFAKAVGANDAQANASPQQRLAAFQKLWVAYRSKSPRMPFVYERLAKILAFTPEVIPELLKDANPEAQKLVRDALAHGVTGPAPMWKELDWRKDINTRRYDPLMWAYIQRNRGIEAIKKQHPKLCHPYPLEGAFRNQIQRDLKQNKLVPWQVMAWINMQWPEDNGDPIKLMRAMVKSPAWERLPFEVRFAAREWFKKDAMTPGKMIWIDSAAATIVCKDLIALPKDADAATTVAALSKAIDGVKKSPVRMMIQGIDTLAKVSQAVFTDPKVMDLILEITDGLRYASDNEFQPFTDRLFAYVNQKKDPVLVSRTAACLWQYGASGSRGRMFAPMKKLTTDLLEKAPDAASSLARTAVEALSHRRSIYGFNPSTRVPEMKTLVGKAAMKMGLLVIPVAKSDPAYPVFKSQGDWMLGNEDSAWDLVDKHWAALLPVHRQLSVDYLAWVLQRTIFTRNDRRQEELIKALLAWAQEENTPFSLAQRANLEIAYGDIAVQRGLLKEARQIFTRTQKNKAYAGLRVSYKAALRRVRVERMAKDFDGALKTLNELQMDRVPEIWGAIHYARAEVYYDMEQYEDAADELNKILAREPDNAEAKVMLGKVDIKRQKLIDAIELDVVPGTDQKTIVPGEKLKVTLNDPTLAVSGAGTEIEVAVWAESGDKEHFFLRQFGDNKTKFRGEIMVKLGAPNVGDRVLQVIGDDKVYYSYTDRFRKKMKMTTHTVSGPITIASNALLMVSARKLLTQAEQRVADMEAKMLEISKGGPVSRAALGGAQAETAAEIEQKIRSGENPVDAVLEPPVDTRVKPGNPIHVRVIDPDRSRTPGIDELSVSAESSSGDAIGRIVLKETGPYTGTFEGKIPTTGAQAMAFAPNTEAGRNPNMVISPVKDYPAWRPEAKAGTIPEFKIDLNDNVPLGEMTIQAAETGDNLKQFFLMTGMNGSLWTTVAHYPVSAKNKTVIKQPWHPSVFVVLAPGREHHYGTQSIFDGIKDYVRHMDTGWMREAPLHQYGNAFATNVSGPSRALPKSIPTAIDWKRSNRWPNPGVVVRFQAYFYETRKVTRRFGLKLGKPPEQAEKDHRKQVPEFLMMVDGRRINGKGKPPEGGVNLRPGVHKLEIWTAGWIDAIGFGRDGKLLANLGSSDELVNCPDTFFSPETFPKGSLAHRNSPAHIKATADNTRFTVTFAPGSRARLLKLVLLGQEGAVPTLNKITLHQPGGKQVLPVATDYAKLKKNDQLEILVGDKVAVRYIDDRFVTKSKEKLERFLNVSYSTASVAFQFFEMRENRQGEMEPYYERLLRFSYGKPVTLTVVDADMDVSVKPDTVAVTVENQDGKKVKLVATEDGPATGTFRVTFTPVAGSPTGKNQIQVAEGGTLTAIYFDKENTQPGVPTYRYASIKHAVFSTPVMRLANATVTPIDFKALENPLGLRGLNIGFETQISRRKRLEGEDLSVAERQRLAKGEKILPRWQINAAFCDMQNPPKGGISVVNGQMLYVEIEAPYMATRLGSTVSVYAQTESGRKRARANAGPAIQGVPSPPAYDINVPGTIKMTAKLVGTRGGEPWGGTPLIPIYIGGGAPPRTDGQRPDLVSSKLFGCSVPLMTDFLPEEGVLEPEEIARRRKMFSYVTPHGLAVRTGEKIYIGLNFRDKGGVEHWVTGTAKVISNPVLDVLEDDYQTSRTSAYVGETLNVRVVDLGGDISDEADTISVLMQAKSGAKYQVELREADPHSGVFKGGIQLTYRNGPKTSEAEDPNTVYNVKRDGFPVVYGDTVGIRYTNAYGQETHTHILTISKGADGTIEPFSKKYDDPVIAMQTQFALADSYLSLARKHRKLGKTKTAGLEFNRAKQLLAKSMDQLREPLARAQAEYLLGTLTMEEASTATGPDLQETRYRAALSRFMNVTGTYPDTLSAGKAQFQIATVYEKLGEPGIAAQEYVKLAYKYPESEYLATAMGKLGQYFLVSAQRYEAKATPLLENVDDKDDQFDGQALWKMAVREYVKSARMFSRLQERFPTNEKAGPAGLIAGKAYLRGGQTHDALAIFTTLIKNKSYDGANVRAPAMYWAGLCYEKLKQDMAAYSMYKRLTYDFPESKSAAYARGQLSQNKLQTLETDLEIKRLEEGR